ncbi:MAG: hypothetical protein F4Z00_17820 [Acidimicrobiaceae bacterium]|nr:hypothetical protein [Acidimicrobiaceae bacterium]MXY09883.1 hypothetical protein [Acidimicrobiaceae bacterium]MXY12103.1 hypothetical protein [Acidimicrobiaceae bacterium]MXZ67388.1 hypothetical protein [Acidimicrobiaceae bacterium]MYF33949.1 hypothetical protein [Acidimicrobiaceae bacterium]
MRRGTGALAAALVISVALAWGAPVAAGQQEVPEGGIETRVGVRFVDGGRVEVALQVRSDGAWGDSLLPARRFMPAPGKPSRWLSTSPIALQGAEARVVARRLADGVVTVALRARALDGDWGERLLPRQRLLYASSQRGVWLWSSPVTLDPPAAQIVAFYGHPGVPAMGVLGHGTPAEIAAQMAVWVDRYDRLNGPRGAIGAFHLITGVAQANPTTDGTWIYRLSHERIATYVEAAREHGMLLFLDNQIGWSDPLAEVQLLEDFLKEPFVHMALDPEFATAPLGVRPGLAIGGITGDQVNEVLEYLSALVESEGLPTKILMVHQFAERMLHDREVIEPQPGVELSIDMDGIGTPRAKLRGYRLFAITEPSQLPTFKLFFTQDTPLMTPEEVQAMEPVPDVVIYQ